MEKKESNKYPDIILSDSLVVNINIKKDKIIVGFSEYGYFIKDLKSNKYYRTDGGEILIEGFDKDNIYIMKIRMQQMEGGLYFKTMHEINVKDFIENINSGKWKLEIVEEFYAVGKGFYIARVRTSENSFWCQIKIYFNKLIYLWSSIRFDRPY